MRVRYLKVRSKLVVSFALLSLFCSTLVTISIYSEVRPYFLEAVEVTLIDTSRLLASQLAVEAEREAKPTLRTETLKSAAGKLLSTKFPRRNVYDKPNQAPLRLLVTDDKGVVVFDSNAGEFEGQDFSKWRDIGLTLKGQYGARATRLDPNDARTSTHFVAAPIVAGGAIIGVLSVGKPVESVSGFLQSARLRILFLFLAGLSAALVLSALAAYWISRPILRLENYVKSLSTPSPENFPRLSPDEIGALGESFETLRKELEGKEYVERYVHNITHEIKSPLTGIIGAAELLSDAKIPQEDRSKLLSNIQTEARRLQEIAEKLLELASLEARDRNPKIEPFDLDLLLEEVVESFDAQLRLFSLTVEFHVAEDLPVSGERFLIWRAVSNLMQNAIDFSPNGGTIVIEALKEGDSVRVAVKDEGPGIPAFASERVTEKFFSLERPRTGKKSSGLGLSFVAEVMSLHRGELSLETSERGTTARLSWKA